jgi:hypothetical protein
MPFKHNAARRHRIPKTRYRVQNWPAYEAGLKRRGDLTLWLDEGALDLLRKSGEFPMSYEELDDTAATVYEGI